MKKILPLLLVSGLLASIFSCTTSSSDTQANLAKAPIPAPPAKRLSETQFGIPTDSYQLVQNRIEKNQFLAEILSPHEVPYQKIDQMARKSREVFDVRKMKAGNTYTLLKNKLDGKVDYFVYEINPVDFVVFDLSDTVNIYTDKKEVTHQRKEASGVIYSSLYQTIQQNDLDINLASKLEDMYAWSVDFFHTQKGDYFKVVYDEAFVEGNSIGISTIHSAVFHHGEQDYFAIGYEQEGRFAYFDEEGNSLRKAFLKAPLKYSRISSRFSRKRFHPILKRYRPHLGVDYAAPSGTPIRSIGDGTVVKASYTKGNGRFVKVQHNSVYATQYLHMSRFAKGVRPGKSVKQGDIIGYVGSTGLATGPHLCFRFWRNGVQVNPLSIESPPTEPVAESQRSSYGMHAKKVLAQLERIPLRDPLSPTFAEAGSSSSSQQQ